MHLVFSGEGEGEWGLVLERKKNLRNEFFQAHFWKSGQFTSGRCDNFGPPPLVSPRSPHFLCIIIIIVLTKKKNKGNDVVDNPISSSNFVYEEKKNKSPLQHLFYCKRSVLRFIKSKSVPDFFKK